MWQTKCWQILQLFRVYHMCWQIYNSNCLKFWKRSCFSFWNVILFVILQDSIVSFTMLKWHMTCHTKRVLLFVILKWSCCHCHSKLMVFTIAYMVGLGCCSAWISCIMMWVRLTCVSKEAGEGGFLPFRSGAIWALTPLVLSQQPSLFGNTLTHQYTFAVRQLVYQSPSLVKSSFQANKPQMGSICG